MTWDGLTILAVTNAVVTFLLWGKIANMSSGRPKLNKKAAKALWRSEPIVPKHDPPKAAGGEWQSLARDVDRLFFADFKDFADVVNSFLAGEYVASRFRLQDLPDADLSLSDYSDGPELGRSFAIYYNQTRVGLLEIRPARKYTAELPEVYTTVEIDSARFFGFERLTEFLNIVASHVAYYGPESDEFKAAQLSIMSALTSTLWNKYNISEYDFADDADWGELTVSFRGPAAFLDRRDAPARPRAG
jgi:hypothetical protein